jgi:hypothetical protein
MSSMAQTFKRKETRVARVRSGEMTSQAIGLGDYIVGAVITPAALTSSALTFMASTLESGEYLPVYDGETLVSMIVGPSRAIGLTGTAGDAVSTSRFIKVVCGSAEAADREITLVLY